MLVYDLDIFFKKWQRHTFIVRFQSVSNLLTGSFLAEKCTTCLIACDTTAWAKGQKPPQVGS